MRLCLLPTGKYIVSFVFTLAFLILFAASGTSPVQAATFTSPSAIVTLGYDILSTQADPTDTFVEVKHSVQFVAGDTIVIDPSGATPETRTITTIADPKLNFVGGLTATHLALTDVVLVGDPPDRALDMQTATNILGPTCTTPVTDGTNDCDSNFASLIAFTPPDFYIAHGTAIPLGAVVGGLMSKATLGTTLAYAACKDEIPVSFDQNALAGAAAGEGMVNASIDTQDTISAEPPGTPNRLEKLGFDLDANGLGDAVDKYPEYLNDLFDPDGPRGPKPPMVPRARYIGMKDVVGTWVVLNFIVFNPGQLKEAYPAGHPLSQFGPEYGYPSITILQDPSVPVGPQTIVDFCAPLTVSTRLLGITAENYATGTSEVGYVRAKTPPASTGIGGSATHLFLQFSTSIRDTDNDGFENSLDSCTFIVNDPAGVGFNPRDINGQSTLFNPANPTDTSIDVVDDSQFSAGNEIIIEPGGSQEIRTLTSVPGDGSLYFTTGLASSHAFGDDVVHRYDTEPGTGDSLAEDAVGCDPTAGTNTGVPAGYNHDTPAARTPGNADAFLNREDNCPRTVNMGQADSESQAPTATVMDSTVGPVTAPAPRADGGTWGNAIGDACESGTGFVDSDYDNDGTPNLTDNCTYVSNVGQADTSGFGTGDACRPTAAAANDLDGDGTLDAADRCPLDPNTGTDADGDGVDNACDEDPGTDTTSHTIVTVVGPGQFDLDSVAGFSARDLVCIGTGPNGEGRTISSIDVGLKRITLSKPVFYTNHAATETVQMLDDDGDCRDQATDKCPMVFNPDQEDADVDGIGNACDPSGGFGFSAGVYNTILLGDAHCIADPAGMTAPDSDSDGDPDDDDDGFCDLTEDNLLSDRHVGGKTPEDVAIQYSLPVNSATLVVPTDATLSANICTDALDNDGDTDFDETGSGFCAPHVAGDTDGDGLGAGDNCSTTFNPGQRNTDVDLNAEAGLIFFGGAVPSDADGDACDADDDNDSAPGFATDFTDSIEYFVGTDPLDPCPRIIVDPNPATYGEAGEILHDTWPANMNRTDRLVNSLDLIPFKNAFQASVGSPAYDRRVDLDASGKVDSLDLIPFKHAFQASCTVP